MKPLILIILTISFSSCFSCGVVGLRHVSQNTISMNSERVSDGVVPYRTYPEKNCDTLSLAVKLKSDDGIFLKGDKISLGLKLENYSSQAMHGKIVWSIYHDTGEALMELVKSVHIPSDSVIDHTLSVAILEPGFYYSGLTYKHKDVVCKFDTVIRFGYAVTQLHTGMSKPNDFEAFWTRTKSALHNVDPRYSLFRVDSLSNDKRAVYLVEMRSLDNVSVKGWYTVPAGNGKYPALLKTQGYSSPNRPELNLPDFVVFSLNIRGHGNSTDDVNPGFPGFISYGLFDKENYIYRGAYMDCIRAVDFLCSRIEVDTTRIAVEGDSQGGGLAFAVTALDNRIDLCAAGVPFLSDFRTYLKINKNSALNNFMRTSNKSFEDLYRILDYFDVSNMTPWIKCPVYMSVGLQDLTCPNHINFAAFNNVTSRDKQYIVYPDVGHKVWAVHNKKDIEWMRKKFGMVEP